SGPKPYQHSPSSRNKNHYNGGSEFLSIGHCSRYFIHPSKHSVWNTCLHGVTIYCLLFSIPPVVDDPSPCPRSCPEPFDAVGTRTVCMQIAQSNVRNPDCLASFALLVSMPDFVPESAASTSSVGRRGW